MVAEVMWAVWNVPDCVFLLGYDVWSLQHPMSSLLDLPSHYWDMNRKMEEGLEWWQGEGGVLGLC